MQTNELDGKAGSIFARHDIDDDGNPAGGMTHGVGFMVSWQDGPLGRGDVRLPPNGAFVEDIIMVAIDRIESYQLSESACDDNAEANGKLLEALACLNRRTADREARKVEGTHAV